MTTKKKSWKEKMNPKAQWQLEKTTKKFADIPEGATMLIATPTIVEDYVKNIPEGSSSNIQQMRKDLAATYHADFACPVTSGIFLRIVAEKAYEEYIEGKSPEEIVPFWRIIDKKSPTAKKLTFGMEWVSAQRKSEGLPE
ncbi:MAG TPA: hypothetical protein VL098_15610 [Flavipsychrobacter sp.]|nr:hypothetical protein [Flavipsychrobacter sp.]